MDTTHLTHAANMVIRKNNLSALQCGKIAMKPDPSYAVFAGMLNELMHREVLSWARVEDVKNAAIIDQIALDGRPREDHLTMCFMRAMLDTGITYPILMPHAITVLRQSPATVILAFQQALNEGPHNKQFLTLMAKFAEYRLMVPVNG